MLKTIANDPFELSYINYDYIKYKEYLDQKVEILKSKFISNPLLATEFESCPSMEVIESCAKHCRQRCRFAIQSKSTPDSDDVKLHHVMWESGGPNIKVDTFPIASIQIFNMMPILLSELEKRTELHNDLRAINYLSSSAGDFIATLIYERPLDDTWLFIAQTLQQHLTELNIPTVRNISIIGRRKGVKLVVGRDWVEESLTLSDSRVVTYIQVDEGFSNPNSYVNAKVLDWLCDIAKLINSDSNSNNTTNLTDKSDWKNSCHQGGSTDLLEMFCGNGNHTVALAGEYSPHFCHDSFYYYIVVF